MTDVMKPQIGLSVSVLLCKLKQTTLKRFFFLPCSKPWIASIDGRFCTSSIIVLVCYFGKAMFVRTFVQNDV